MTNASWSQTLFQKQTPAGALSIYGHEEIRKYWHNQGNVPSLSKPKDSIFCKTNKS